MLLATTVRIGLAILIVSLAGLAPRYSLAQESDDGNTPQTESLQKRIQAAVDRGDYEEAVSTGKLLLESLDETTPEKLSALESLVTNSFFAGNLEEARDFASRVVEIRTQLQGSNHWQVKQHQFHLLRIDEIRRQADSIQQQLIDLEVRYIRLLPETDARKRLDVLIELRDLESKFLDSSNPISANVLTLIAREHLALGENGLAIEAIQQAIDIAEKAYEPTHPELAHLQSELGYVLQEAERHPEAVTVLQKAVQSLEKHADTANYAPASQRLGYSLAQLGRDEEASEAFRAAAEVYQQQGRSHLQAFSLSQMGKQLRKLGQHRKAADALNRSATLFVENQESGFAASDYFSAAKSLLEIEQDNEAIELFEKAHLSFQAANEGKDAAWMMNWIGDVHKSKDNHREAAISYEKGRDLFLELDDWSGTSESCSRLAESLAKLQDHQGAAEAYALASEAFEKQGIINQSATMNRLQGESLLNCNEYNAAEAAFALAVSKIEESKDPYEYGLAVFGFGKSLANLGRYSSAAAAYLRASEAFATAELPVDSAVMYAWAGNILLSDNQLEEAEIQFQRFATTIQALDKPIVMALQVNHIAESLLDAKHYERAAHYATLAQKTAMEHKIQSEILRSLFILSSSHKSLKESNKNHDVEHDRFLNKLIELLVEAYSENPRPPFFLKKATHCKLLSNLLRQNVVISISEGDTTRASQALTILAWLSEQKRETDFVHLCELGQDLFRKNQTDLAEACVRIAQAAKTHLDKLSFEAEFQYALLVAWQPSERISGLAGLESLLQSSGEQPKRILLRMQYYMLLAELANRDGNEEQVGKYVTQAFREISQEFPGQNIPAHVAKTTKTHLNRAAVLPGARVSDLHGEIMEMLAEMSETFSQTVSVDNLSMAWLFAARSFVTDSDFREQARNAAQKAYKAAKESNNRERVAEAIEILIQLKLEDIIDEEDSTSLLPMLEERFSLRKELGETEESFGAQLDVATHYHNSDNHQQSVAGFKNAIDIAKRFLPEERTNRPFYFGFMRMGLLDYYDLSYVTDRFIQRLPKVDDGEPTSIGWAIWIPKRTNPISIPAPAGVSWLSLTEDPEQIEVDWYRGLAGIIEATSFQPDSLDKPLKPFVLAGKHVFPHSDRFAGWLTQSQNDFHRLREYEKDERTLFVEDVQIDQTGIKDMKLSERARRVAELLRRRAFIIKRNDSAGLTIEVEFELSSPSPDVDDLAEGLTECLAIPSADMPDQPISKGFGKFLVERLANAVWHKRQDTNNERIIYYISVDLMPSELLESQEQFRIDVAKTKQLSQLTILKNQLRQIWLGIMSRGASDRKELKPFSVDRNGKPLLSWRVHLLPYLGDDAAKLYEQFHLNESWDSPHNRRLISRIPRVYKSLNSEVGKTPFLIVTGPGTMWPSASQPARLPLGRQTSLSLITVDDSDAVIWTKPDDYVLDPNKVSMPKLLSRHPEGAPVVMSNGAIRLADPSAQPDWFHYWTQIDRPAWSHPSNRSPDYFFMGYEQEQIAQRRQSSLVELQQLGTELKSFRLLSGDKRHPTMETDDQHDCLPQYSVDKSGKPLLSWRVHLLPFLGYDDLYSKFRLDEPWDSEVNRALLSEMPEIYCHPEDRAIEGKTRYQMLIGKGTDYETRIGPKMKAMWQREVSRNIALVSTPSGSAVEWTRPSDFDVSNFKATLLNPQASPATVDCVLDNAAVLQLDNSMNHELLHDWITPEIEIRSPEQKLQNLSQALVQWTKERAASNSLASGPNIESKLSWRVHILPYLGLKDLYEQFHLNEPWDSDHNRSLLGKMPDIYSMFPDNDEPGQTCVMRLSGRGTIAEALEKNNVSLYAKSAILLLTVNGKNRVPWTKPVDLTVPEDFRIRDVRSKPELPSSPPFEGVLWETTASEFRHPLIALEIRSIITDNAPETGTPVVFSYSAVGNSALMSSALPAETWQHAMSAAHGIQTWNLSEANIKNGEKARYMKLPRRTALLPTILHLDRETGQRP